MNDRYVLTSKVNGLVIKKFNILFRKIGLSVDLVGRTGKSVRELENDSEIKNLIAINYLEVTERYEHNVIVQDQEHISKKLDLILGAMSDKDSSDGLQEIISLLGSKLENFLSEKLSGMKVRLGVEESDGGVDEIKMREEALMKIIENKKDSELKMDSFGKTVRKVENESEGNEDIIDF